ncbi:MAG: diacylglycerol kinase family lipid kinase [Planctomycetia bacterium]|nr:diacylglycerol kinase family lipid kinase [Planctomycetia bacterium]
MASTPNTAANRVAIQRNPRSGSGAGRHELVELVRELKRLSFRPRLFKSRERLAAWMADPAIRAETVCVVAAGGDGTVADVFNRYPGVPISILPLGTENLLARHLGLSRSGRELAHVIAGRHRRAFDLCQMRERRFVLMASAGFDADVISRLHETRRGHISRASYVQPILESVRKYEYPEFRVWVDDAPIPLTGRLAVIVNVPIYALGLSVARSATGDDGLLDVRLFQRGSAFQMVRYLCNLALGRHEGLADVLSVRGRRVRIESDVPVPIQVDGDAAGQTPVEISVLPSALEILVPAGAATSVKDHA